MNRQTVFRIVAGLVLVAVLAAAGFALFNAGTRYGVAQSPEWARLMEQRMEAGGAGMMPGDYMGMMPDGMGPWMMRGGPGMGFGPHMGGWGMGWGHGFGIFGVLGFLFQLFLLFIVLRLIFGVFFGWRRWGWGWHGGPGGWEQKRREMFDEWHKQAHSGGSEPAPSAGSEQQSQS